MDDQRSMQQAFESGGLVVNAEQARALAALLERGALEGTSYDDVRPPRAVALAGLGERVACEPLDRLAVHSLGVVADDGRVWNIAPARITWPVEWS